MPRRRQRGSMDAEHRQSCDMIPMGQPILVGHHSEGRHRRDLDRTERLCRRGMDEAERPSTTSTAPRPPRLQAHRESIPTTLRRIEKLEAEERSMAAAP